MINNNYSFRLATYVDLPEIINILKERQEWFKQKGIKQWRNYLKNHPLDEWINCIRNKSLYVVTEENKIVGCVEIKYLDPSFWDNSKALYIHKFFTKITKHNIGSYILKNLKKIARQNNLNKIRLDCLSNNKKLNNIYDGYGFKIVGSRL